MEGTTVTLSDVNGLDICSSSAEVTAVRPGGPAHSSGLTEGMQILKLEYDGSPIAIEDYANPGVLPLTITFKPSPIKVNNDAVVAIKEIGLKNHPEEPLTRHTRGKVVDWDKEKGAVLFKTENHCVWVPVAGGILTGCKPRKEVSDEVLKDVAVLLTQVYSAEGTGLGEEEYAELCKDIGMDNAYENAKDREGKVTPKALRQTAGRLLVEHEQILRDIALSKAAAANIGKTRDTVCAGKAKDAQPASLGSVNIELISKKLASIYAAKNGGVLEELLENLVSPRGTDKLLVLAEASRELLVQKAKHYPGRTQLDLLIMYLYTMAGPDIDQLMQYTDVPEYGGDEWTKYTEEVTPERNGALFSAVNGIMRGVTAPDFDWGCVKKWIKTICHLFYLCVKAEAPMTAKGLARGLAGLPDHVVASHKSLKPGSELHWTAPSSCAIDPEVAHSYIAGTAANAVKKQGGSILFSVGGVARALPLQEISKYPKEAEVLVPPLSSFKVTRVGETKGYLEITLEWQCVSEYISKELLSKIAADAKTGTEMMNHRSDEKDAAAKLLFRKPLGSNQPPPWLPTSPRPGFRIPITTVSPLTPRNKVKPQQKQEVVEPVLDHHSHHIVPCFNIHSPTSTSPRRQRGGH
eukprot:TRINITY_DN20667_c0_g1_i1.p1 TRINITY_DN20667_c0_g1~~TRINITY_DN20667_c0_g1_i1.p1  ORF type:complete len:733 (+),score=157.48 TRINITY_DN20667_c0_g1_i1:299-2200(+)